MYLRTSSRHARVHSISGYIVLTYECRINYSFYLNVERNWSKMGPINFYISTLFKEMIGSNEKITDDFDCICYRFLYNRSNYSVVVCLRG